MTRAGFANIAIRRTMAAGLLLLACTRSPTTTAPTERPPRTPLRWNLERAGDRIGPTSVSWIRAGRVAWTVPLPTGLRFTIANDATARLWLHNQRFDDGYAKYWAIAEFDGAVAMASEGDLLVVDVADGAERIAWTMPSAAPVGFGGALFDQGDIDATSPSGSRCRLHVESQNFLLACEKVLFYFDQGTLALFDTGTGRVLATTPWRGPDIHDLHGDCPGTLGADVDQTQRVLGWTIHARGRRQTFCQT